MCLDLPGMQGHFNERKCYLPVLERGIKGSYNFKTCTNKVIKVTYKKKKSHQYQGLYKDYANMSKLYYFPLLPTFLWDNN